MPADDLAFTPAWELRDAIAAGQLSPVELVDLYLRRIDSLDPRLNAYLTVCADESLAAARLAQEAVAQRKPLGPLHGLPIPIKDLNQTKGIRTTRGSLLFKDFVPTSDEPMVERIRNAGAIILGKTNTPEFGHRGTTENLLGDACRNPWDTQRTSGGSSGGAAAAVAAGLCAAAQGSDGGGSIRTPASFCGVYGIKPSAGRVPRSYRNPGGWGILAQDGPIGRTVKDAALLLQAMAGPHPDDPGAIGGPVPDFLASLEGGVRGLRVAWSADLGGNPVDPEVRDAAHRGALLFATLGAYVEELDATIDHDLARETFKTLFLSDYDAGLGRVLDTRPELLMPSLRVWLEEARSWPAARLARALRDLEWHRARLREIFSRYDLLLTPANAVTAFPVEQWPDTIDGVSVDGLWAFNPFCYVFNLTGQPAASVPCGFSTLGLPIGLHVVGRVGEEATVLRASASFEEAQPWAHHRPPVS